MNRKGFNYEGELIYELKNGNRFVKEYDIYNDELIFEGEYWNGEKNGRRKKYKYCNKELESKFDGEYFNNNKEWNGTKIKYEKYIEIQIELVNEKNWNKKKEYNLVKDKEYNDRDIVIYEGDNLNGQRHGKGKEYIYIKNG